MCPPKFFGIEYEINAWMHTGEQIDSVEARKQWQKLYDTYTQQLGWHVELIEPVRHLPDMVFATDCCLMIDGKIMLSNFRHPERQPESMHYETWLRDQGFAAIHKARGSFEGGDSLLCGDKILAGYGFRSEAAAAHELQRYFGREVISLRIVDPFFYHLDTSVAVLSDDTIAFYPGAIDKDSQKRLRGAIPNVIEATLEEAQDFGLNAVSDGKIVITSDTAPSLLRKYRAAGFETIGLPISEFRKSGGGIHCMTLELRS